MAKKEYIEREKAIEEIRLTFCKECNSYNGVRCRACEFDDAMSLMEDVPVAADVVEVRHGKWFLLDECSNEGVYCSVCTKKVYRTEYANQRLKSPYCPNCGAKMDGGENNG